MSQQTSESQTTDKKLNAPLLVSLLLVFDSLHFVFAKLLSPYMPPESGAFYVLTIAALQIFVISLFRGGVTLSVFTKNLWFFIALGVMVGVSTVMNYTAVSWIDPGTASLLGKTSVLFGVGFGVFWLREKLSAIEVIGSFVAITGVVVIFIQPGEFLQLGSAVVLGSTFLYSLHAAVTKRFGEEMDILDFLFFRLACTAGIVFILATAQGALVWPSSDGWLVVLLAATVDVVISRFLYYVALRRLNLSFHSIILTLSPVVTILWTLLLFKISPDLEQILGGLAVLIGVFIVALSRYHMERASKRRLRNSFRE
jgi:drug/metabolite transporter (DMT)-like permease